MRNIEKSTINITPDGIVVPGNTDVPTKKHSEDIQEIITKLPSWLVRWGITFLFAVLLLLGGIAALVRYPETLTVPLKIESAQPVTEVFNTKPAYISKVFIKKGEKVKKGQPLLLVCGVNDDTSRIVYAPKEGQIAFAAIVEAGSVLAAGQKIYELQPLNQHLFGVINIPLDKFSKVKIGQELRIKLNANVDEDHLPLEGRVEYIADVPGKDGSLLAKINISQSADANKLESWMSGSADIVTQDMSVFQRVYKSSFSKIR